LNLNFYCLVGHFVVLICTHKTNACMEMQ
jgi:hypothetical protein